MACLPTLRGSTPDWPVPNVNVSVDCILRTIYQKRPGPSGNGGRRRIVFTSFSPDVCAALNWKQPNCKYLRAILYPAYHCARNPFPDPVFFASLCGREASVSPSPTSLANAEARDERSSSLESAVRFSKANNLLGVFIEGDILVSTHLAVFHPKFHVTHRLFPSSPRFCCPRPIKNQTVYQSNNELHGTEKYRT